MIFDPLVRGLQRWLTKEVSQPAHHKLSNFERLRHEIKPGDVVLVEGTTRVADVIRQLTQSRWSHAALYIGRLHDIEDPLARQRIKQFYDGQPNTQLIIESELGMGTLVRPLHVYRQKHLRLCRPRELSYPDSQQLLVQAINHLGIAYDVRQILDLARFYMPWGVLPRRWASSLFNWQPGGHTKIVCSTMIAESFAAIQFPVLPLVKRVDNGQVRLFQRNPKLCVPADFDLSPYFDVIKYPFMDFDDRGDSRYRLLPWQGDIRLNANETGVWIESEPESKEAPEQQD